jgi:transposase-like protein
MKVVKLKDSRTVKHYSEAFKQRILKEIRTGKFSKNEICRKYGISVGSIYFWIKKYNYYELYNPRIRIEMPNEIEKNKSIREENKRLKEALVRLQLKHLKSEADLAIAMEQLGYENKEEFEKKRKANPYKKR